MTEDRFTISDELIHRYSRRGNFHTDAAQSDELGLPGLVAQGTQATGRAYGQLLSAWGETFLAHGTLDVRFVGMVIGGDEIDTSVTYSADGANDADTADIVVTNTSRSHTAVIGRATRSTNAEALQ